MSTSKRIIKQIVIASIYIIIFLVVVISIWFSIFPPQPKVEEVKPIEILPLKILEFKSLEVGNGRTDLIAFIENPNISLGLETFQYRFILESEQGAEEKFISGNSFIAPGEDNRAIVSINNDIRGYRLKDFQVFPKREQWQNLENYVEPNILIREVSGVVSDSLSKPFLLRGVLRNASEYQIREIELIAILTNDRDEIIAINKTMVNNVSKESTREFSMLWDNNIIYSNETILPYTNVLQKNLFNDDILKNPEIELPIK